MGTVGGNLRRRDPLTDPGASLIALDADHAADSEGTTSCAWTNFSSTIIKPLLSLMNCD